MKTTMLDYMRSRRDQVDDFCRDHGISSDMIWASLRDRRITMLFKHKNQNKTARKSYDLTLWRPVLRCSICTGEQVAGFREIATGHYEEVTLIRNAADLEQFRRDYSITSEISKEY